ncbi:hypothetical protein [Mesorhizobium sp. M0213]|uniref:hypothetical protein n=1 Tax=Mesorhizobium sp. M0213 TaxID=2956917 RepID=UPI003338F15D
MRAVTAAQSGVNPLVDDFGRAVETACIRQELLTAAEKAGVATTPEESAKTDALAQSYADASVAIRQLAEQQDVPECRRVRWPGQGRAWRLHF